MISKILVCLVGVALIPGIRAAPPSAASAIKAVLYRQQTAWNQGDTETYLNGYDAKAIVVSSRITQGMSEIRVLYQTIYPTIESMGHLALSGLDVHIIDATHAYVIGRWRLDRKPAAGGPSEGFHTMVFAKTAAGWKIVLDHTS